LRILVAGDWPVFEGGTENYILRVRDGLRAAGDEVRVLTGSTGSRAGGTADYVAPSSERLAAQAFLQVANPFARRAMRAALRDFSPDAVLVTTFLTHLSPAILGPLRAYPTVVFVMDYRPICPIALKLLPDNSLCTLPAGAVCWRSGCVSLGHWLRDIPRYALLRAGLAGPVLTCSRWMRERLAEAGIESEAVELPVPQPPAGYARAPAADPRFVYVGRLRAEKGVDLLLHAFAAALPSSPGSSLRVVGDGPQRAELERLAGDLGLGESISFVGWIPPERVSGELVGAWALVAPSRWAEPLGLSAIEAAVHGVPVIASAAGGFLETVEPGVTGMLFERNDAEALATCLRAVAQGQVFPGQALAEEAVERLRNRYDLTRHVAVLRRALEQTPSSRR
jgi:glycosyltransferase involved in cell wall biosynthesis